MKKNYKESTSKKGRKPIGRFETYSFDKDIILQEALPAGSSVNWSDLARKYKVGMNGVLVNNGNQVLKMFAEKNNRHRSI